jgi:hypothetical protein
MIFEGMKGLIEFLAKNKEWIFSGIGVFVLGLLVTLLSLIRRFKDKREKRIERFVDDFRNLYKNDGLKLEILIPAGINNLKNDKEIKLAFEALMRVVPNHPLRNWKPRVENVGYKRFFIRVVKSGKILDKNSIEIFLSELE